MSAQARTTYLETQVLTATPQKLRLMLIDGAIRLARQTLDCWQAGRNEEAFEALVRCRNIVTELHSTVQGDGTLLTRRIAALYLFLFKTLSEAQLLRDERKLTEAISILEVEQETWRQVCEKMPEGPVPDESAPAPRGDVTSAGMTAILPTRHTGFPGRGPHSIPTASRFSLEG